MMMFIALQIYFLASAMTRASFALRHATLRVAKPAQSVVIPIGDGHKCCDGGLSAKYTGQAEVAMGRTMKTIAQQGGELERQEAIRTAQMAEQAVADKDVAENARIQEGIKREDLAQQKREDSEHELEEKIEADRSQEGIEKEKQKADEAVAEDQLQHETQNLQKLRNEEKLVAGALTSEERDLEEEEIKSEELDGAEESKVKKELVDAEDELDSELDESPESVEKSVNQGKEASSD